ncbi:hypothetical protein AAFF_G00041170 [Aldrovandia affinis]|uniref:Uncharacterized protein n=1 Tax=Aldrovandia affinis TaxID=143900 RepID=A0AAD7S2X2_9TELE|nr:hypothetical protein AAFF_G00041170 [Aldrovandia affinis]
MANGERGDRSGRPGGRYSSSQLGVRRRAWALGRRSTLPRPLAALRRLSVSPPFTVHRGSKAMTDVTSGSVFTFHRHATEEETISILPDMGGEDSETRLRHRSHTVSPPLPYWIDCRRDYAVLISMNLWW